MPIMQMIVFLGDAPDRACSLQGADQWENECSTPQAGTRPDEAYVLSNRGRMGLAYSMSCATTRPPSIDSDRRPDLSANALSPNN